MQCENVKGKYNNLKIINITTTNKSSGTQITNKVEDDYFNNCIYKLYKFNIKDDIK
tara:strand:+ start:740 stop:907 length:168 start_codon:yes stop_codon:yes gene_type:complete